MATIVTAVGPIGTVAVSFPVANLNFPRQARGRAKPPNSQNQTYPYKLHMVKHYEGIATKRWRGFSRNHEPEKLFTGPTRLDPF